MLQDLATNLTFTPFREEDRAAAFALYESALRPIIDLAFGWSSEFQHDRFSKRYPTSSFQKIHHFGSEIGFVSFYETAFELHVSLLILKQDNRNRGLGRRIMQLLHSKAADRSVTLSSFKNNTAAIRFYESLGYKVTGGDAYFSDFSNAN